MNRLMRNPSHFTTGCTDRSSNAYISTDKRRAVFSENKGAHENRPICMHVSVIPVNHNMQHTRSRRGAHGPTELASVTSRARVMLYRTLVRNWFVYFSVVPRIRDNLLNACGHNSAAYRTRGVIKGNNI